MSPVKVPPSVAPEKIETPNAETSLFSHGKLEGRRVLHLFTAAGLGSMAAFLMNAQASALMECHTIETALEMNHMGILAGSSVALLHTFFSVTLSIGSVVTNAICCKKPNPFNYTFAASSSLKLTTIACSAFLLSLPFMQYGSYPYKPACYVTNMIASPISCLAVSAYLYNLLQRIWPPASNEDAQLKRA